MPTSSIASTTRDSAAYSLLTVKNSELPMIGVGDRRYDTRGRAPTVSELSVP